MGLCYEGSEVGVEDMEGDPGLLEGCGMACVFDGECEKKGHWEGGCRVDRDLCGRFYVLWFFFFLADLVMGMEMIFWARMMFSWMFGLQRQQTSFCSLD